MTIGQRLCGVVYPCSKQELHRRRMMSMASVLMTAEPNTSYDVNKCLNLQRIRHIAKEMVYMSPTSL
jgi:hypothetical protein